MTMPDQHEAHSDLAEAIALTFFLVGFLISLGVGVVLFFTQLPGEDLCELVFWPMVGALGFGVALFHLWATKPWDYTNLPQKQ